MDYFELIPNDQIIKIALNLSLNDIYYYCQVNKRFNDIICENELFWKQKINLYLFGSNSYGQLGLPLIL